MMLFQRRLFAELLWNTLTTLALLTVVLMLIICAQVVQREGLTLAMLVRAVPILAASQLDLTLPMSVLVAVVLTYGRAAADNEVDTLRASGVHPLHVALPGLVFGAMMTLVLLTGMDFAKPWAETAKRRIAKETDLGGLLKDKLSTGEPVELPGNYVISAEGFDENGTARNMRVQRYDDEGNLKDEFVARSAALGISADSTSVELHLYDLTSVRGPKLHTAETVITQALPREFAELNQEHLTTPQLIAFLRRGTAQHAGFSPEKARLAVHMRLASASACVLFVLLGMPVALLFRRHDRTAAFLVAFLVALFVYYPAREITKVLSERDVLPAVLASWTGNAFILMVSAALALRVARR